MQKVDLLTEISKGKRLKKTAKRAPKKVDHRSPCSKHGLSSSAMALITSGCG